MTRRQYRNYSILFFFFSFATSCFLIKAFLYEAGINQIISVSLFGILLFTQLRVALSMYQKSRETNLK